MVRVCDAVVASRGRFGLDRSPVLLRLLRRPLTLSEGLSPSQTAVCTLEHKSCQA